MSKFRIGLYRLAVVTWLGAMVQSGMAAPPTVEQILAFKPALPGIEISTPTAVEVAACKVELEEGKDLGQGRKATAWVLKDGQGRVLRKMHDTKGTRGVDVYAYYRDGEEAYREIDTDNNRKINQYRWLGPNGSKWGVDADEDGRIDSWLAISPEELSQEILAAVLAKDQRRLDALLMSKADLDALGLPQPEVARIQAKVASAAGQFQKTCQELAKLPANTFWVHLEVKVPQTIAADALDAKADMVRYRSAAILYQEGEGKDAKHNWIQTGELIQVGRAWKVIQGPVPGMQPDNPVGTDDGRGIPVPPGSEEIIKKINELDQKGPTKPGRQGIIEFNLARATLLEEVARQFKPEDRAKQGVWVRQVADSLAAAAQQGDAAALKRLGEWRAWFKDAAGPIVPYIQFREMTAEYAQKLPEVGSNQDKLNKLQETWKEKLTKFIADHPAADDTPDAIMQLGMVNEFFGSKSEADAKAAYAKLVKSFPSHPLARRAQGCLDRLQLEGAVLNLAGPTLGGGAAFNVKTYLGKVVVVYYWASWNDLATSDFAKIKLAMQPFAGKVELVCVNLDNAAGDALAFLKANPVDAAHLHMPGGLEGPLAVQYGITALPVMFVVGPDGKVVTRHAGATTLDEELKKLLKTDEKK